MTYAEAIQFLYGLQMFGTHFGLDDTFKLAALAGNPQERLRFIHVAGTNGKGSTCAMLESIYRAAGLRVGLFTSPHLVSFRERIQVNRQLISEADVARLVVAVRASLERRSPDRPVDNVSQRVDQEIGVPADRHTIQPTLFEFVTVMALKYFAEQKCDLVIWETGLGGRLDATNIVRPLASVITNIALDHQQWLGDTLEQIAAEKAGIIKPGIPVVTAENKPEVLAVIEHVARKNNSPIVRMAEPSTNKLQPAASLIGEHQRLNAALALATVAVLQNEIPIPAQTISSGLARVHWPGRLQLIERGGRKFLLDGAHNPAGAESLRAALQTGFPGARPALIFGTLEDKKWFEICRLLAPVAGKIITVAVPSPRAADPQTLAEFFRTANPAVGVAAAAGLAEALNALENEPFIVVTGSLYLVGAALEFFGLAPGGANEQGLNDWRAPRLAHGK